MHSKNVNTQILYGYFGVEKKEYEYFGITKWANP